MLARPQGVKQSLPGFCVCFRRGQVLKFASHLSALCIQPGRQFQWLRRYTVMAWELLPCSEVQT